MTIIKAEFAQPTDNEGKAVNIAPTVAGEADSRAFTPIKPDFYGAIVRTLKTKTYNSTWGKEERAVSNPDSRDGLWQYLALTPEVEIMSADVNEGVNSLVTRQDVTVGVQWRGQMYRPDKQPESPFFKEAQNLMSALSGFVIENGIARITIDTDWIIDRPIKVRTGIAGYVAGRNINYTPQKLAEIFTRLNGDDAHYGLEDIPSLVEEYNLEQGYIDDNGEQAEFIHTDRQGNDLEEPLAVRLKLKNAIVGWYLPSNIDVKKYGWYVRNGKVFRTEGHADAFERILEAQTNARDDDF